VGVIFTSPPTNLNSEVFEPPVTFIFNSFIIHLPGYFVLYWPWIQIQATFTFIQVSPLPSAHAHTRTHTHIHTHTHTRAHTNTHTRAHTHTHARMSLQLSTNSHARHQLVCHTHAGMLSHCSHTRAHTCSWCLLRWAHLALAFFTLQDTSWPRVKAETKQKGSRARAIGLEHVRIEARAIYCCSTTPEFPAILHSQSA